MKPNGLVFAASITSQTSMSILWHISAISLTRPMFTARNVFSSSLTISATRVELTGTTVVDDRAVQRGRPPRCSPGPTPPTTFGMFAVVNCALPGIDALGREREEEVDVRLQPAGLEHRLHHFVGRARIGRRLEDDELPGLSVRRHRVDRLHDVGQVGILRLAQRRRHADVDGVHGAELGHVGGGAQRAGCRRRPPRSLVRDVGDVAPAGVDLRRSSTASTSKPVTSKPACANSTASGRPT